MHKDFHLAKFRRIIFLKNQIFLDPYLEIIDEMQKYHGNLVSCPKFFDLSSTVSVFQNGCLHSRRVLQSKKEAPSVGALHVLPTIFHSYEVGKSWEVQIFAARCGLSSLTVILDGSDYLF